MAKKKRTYHEWFPNFDNWILLSLEMVDIFLYRVKCEEVSSEQEFESATNFFKHLQTLKKDINSNTTRIHM